jgi:hypothetical protein
VFRTSGEITADDTSRSDAMQAFRYDAVTGQLLRVSHGDDGFNDNGNRSTPGLCAADGAVCSEEVTLASPRLTTRMDPSMSEDGSRVFFQSPLALTAHALNDVQIGNEGEFLFPGDKHVPVYAQNLYEWESEGVGSCQPGRSTGCVFLISDGRDVTENHGTSNGLGCIEGPTVCLLGTDATGSNVFFSTADQLVGSDTNTELDYYDARVCEPERGDPCVASPPPPSPGCSGEECHGVPAGVPGVPAAPSMTFDGSGNVIPPAQTTVAKKAPPLTRAQKLANALRVCRKDKKKARRKSCEVSARDRYGAAKRAKRSGHNGRGE